MVDDLVLEGSESLSIEDGHSSLIENEPTSKEFDSRSDERGYALIANFEEGFATGWKMAVSESFKDALDIKLTPRILNKKKCNFLTQGKLYSFKEGDTIHSSTRAYDEELWEDSLKHIQISVQVESSQSSKYVTYEKIDVSGENITISSRQSKGKKTIESVSSVVLKKQRIDHGRVSFTVFTPDDMFSRLVEKERLECTQDDFVAFLQTGLVRTNENKTIDLFEKYPKKTCEN